MAGFGETAGVGLVYGGRHGGCDGGGARAVVADECALPVLTSAGEEDALAGDEPRGLLAELAVLVVVVGRGGAADAVAGRVPGERGGGDVEVVADGVVDRHGGGLVGGHGWVAG